MTDLAVQVMAEIRLLRKGRGIHAADLDQRLGPHLRTLTAAENGSTPSRREVLTTVIDASCAGLPDDLDTAIRASLAMNGETRRMALFKDRVRWLAGHIGRIDRTALRRIENAERLLAERLAAELRRRAANTATTPDGWYVRELRTVLRLDTPMPEAHEFRRIVAVRDGLRRTMAWLDVPRQPDEPPAELGVEVLYGGRLVRQEGPSRTRLHFVLELPRPLRAGEEHEFGIILRVPAGRSMRPHYIVTPECRMDSLELRVRFHPQRPPRWVRQVCGETVRMFESARPGSAPMVPDGSGEVVLRFDKPSWYLGYGAQWQL